MSELPGDLLYTDEHEWLRREDDGSVTIGITDHAQAALGDLVYVELPEVNQSVDSGGDMAVVESVKALRSASEVKAPDSTGAAPTHQGCMVTATAFEKLIPDWQICSSSVRRIAWK